MLRRIGIVLVMVGLLSLWTSPADAKARPLALFGSSVRLNPPSPGEALQCSDRQCGFVAVTVVLTGLAGRDRPGSSEPSDAVALGGTVEVKRTFGCRRVDGRRLAKYDRSVRDKVHLVTVDGSPLTVPSEGDVYAFQAYGFFPGARPKTCPAGAQALLGKVEVTKVHPRLVSSWDAIPSKTYKLPDKASWSGAVAVVPPAVPDPSTPGADASTGPLPLYGSTTTLSPPVPGPLNCRDRQCGSVAVHVVLTGLDGRARPTTAHDLNHTLNVGGSVDVTQDFGCRRNGKRVHRYDQLLRGELGLGTPRGFPYFVPQTGDTFEFTVYAFSTADLQLKACPAGTQLALYSIKAKKARVELLSQWDPIPSQTYAVPDKIAWRGVVPLVAPAG